MLDIFNDVRQWGSNTGPWLRILIIWILAWCVLTAVQKSLRLLKTNIVGRVDELRESRRIGTLMNVFRYTANVVTVGLAIMLTLGEIGISITPILATAGVAGIAVGFGAQSLVKDFFTGLFLLIENQVSEGDIIETAGKSGYVERVTLRHIRIRDYDGSVHFIPNGMITTVTNRSRDYAYAVIDLSFSRQEEIEQAYRMMRQVSEEMRNDTQLNGLVLEDVDIAGIDKLEDASVSVRCRIKVKPGKQWRVRREFLKRIKVLMDKNQEATMSAA